MSKGTEVYDLIVVGAGPAGYTAAIYARRFRLKTMVIGTMPGGLISEAHKVCNFPTYTEISGMDLATKIQAHAKTLGAEELYGTVTNITREEKRFVVEVSSGERYSAKSLVIATGTKRRKLGLSRENELTGKGVSYCATCDGPFYKNKVVAVVGGSNAATTAALLLADIAQKVYLIYRRDQLRGEQVWVEEVKETRKIEVLYNTNVVQLLGSGKLEGLRIDNSYAGKTELAVDGLFVEIGSVPECPESCELIKVETDESGYIKVHGDQSTNVDGIFAAGDITTNSNGLRQVVTACAEGAVAAESVYRYVTGR